MEPDFFKNLASEIITEIFLRLPAVSIPISKYVCKRWLHLLEPDDFIKSHFARSTPALVVLGDSGRLKVLESEGELNLHLHLDPLTQYDFPYHRGNIYSSVNGLLVLRMRIDVDLRMRVDMLSVCNPITREIIKLDLPTDPKLAISEASALGFGASKITREIINLVCAGEASGYVDCGFFTPTLVSLKTLGLGVENVISF